MRATDPIAVASTLLGRELRAVETFTAGQHAQTLLATDGTTEVIVRRFPADDPAAAEEALILPRLRPLGGLAPTFLASNGSRRNPVIVTSALPGSHPDPHLSPDTIATEMARALVRIHALDPTGLRREPRTPPEGSSAVATRARAEFPELDTTERVLTHFDFWSGNALWTGESLTGVVDWSGAREAPRGVDLAWCRQDLVLLGSPASAEVLLAEYEDRLGRPVPDITAWDVQAAARADPQVETWTPNYRGIGRPNITAEVLRQRLGDWIASL